MKKLPSIKKSVKAFLTSEEGKLSKKNALKLGIGLGMIGTMLGGGVAADHSSYFENVPGQGGQHSSHAAHSSHTSHSSHGAHGSHSSHTSHSSHGAHGSHSSHTSHSSHESGSHSAHTSHNSHGSHASHGSHTSHGSHSSHGSHTSHSSHSSHGSHTSHSSHSQSGCCCPFIAVWNGQKFITENNILPLSENISRKDIIVDEFYKLETPLKSKDNKYQLQIQEFENSHCYFQDFNLLKIIHPEGVNIAVANNKIIAYRDLITPSLIEDQKGRNLSKELSEMNDNKFFHGEKGDRLRIKFDNLQKFKNPYLLIRAAMRAEYPRVDNIIEKIEEISPSPRKLGKFLEKVAISMATVGSLAAALKAAGTVSKYSIHIKMLIKGKKGAEKEIGIVHPRERFSFNLIDISKYIGKTQQSLRLVLEWTQPHNLSFIGLANSNPKDINQLKIEKLKLSELRHSHNADVNKDTLKNGEIELIPGQFLSLEFPAEKAEIGVNQKISFILETKGYYTKI